ncbi:hypothetical protein [Robertmurraya andreesenii]|uniref:Tissue inhibitor of metalloproteinase n=1 Tax=Anoxybacillus andreesenii TaxID=1325932 RepID=A0ABT9V0U1_9BACL|nr:hypothetical protein [Robertmurraya andreesenii]MDQ0154533.1 hypothetical protein [Robertmurraya andreesenii]
MKDRLFKCMLTMLFLSGSTLIFPNNIYACSCVGIEPAEAFEKSEAVFLGRVLNTKPEQVHDGVTVSYRTANLFEVTQIWKGTHQSQMLVFDNGYVESCGIGFEEGKTYLVYASKNENGEFRTGLCSRTEEASKAGEDLKFLGQGKEMNHSSEVNKTIKKYDMEIFIGGIIVVFMLALFIFKKGRQKHR